MSLNCLIIIANDQLLFIKNSTVVFFAKRKLLLSQYIFILAHFLSLNCFKCGQIQIEMVVFFTCLFHWITNCVVSMFYTKLFRHKKQRKVTGLCVFAKDMYNFFLGPKHFAILSTLLVLITLLSGSTSTLRIKLTDYVFMLLFLQVEG